MPSLVPLRLVSERLKSPLVSFSPSPTLKVSARSPGGDDSAMLFRTRRRNRAHAEAFEIEHDARLAKAERDLADLTTRGQDAVRALDARNGRNHWRESIEQMIQGATG